MISGRDRVSAGASRIAAARATGRLRFRLPLAAVLLGVTMASVSSGVAGAQGSAAGVRQAAPDPVGAVLPLRDRPAVVNRILEERLETLLPELMRGAGLDMWLVINREYAEDPVYLTLAPEPVFAARRTTMLVFFDRGPEKGVERLTVSRYPLGSLYEPVWEGGDLDAQWRALASVIEEREPRRIGIDVSRDWPVADGLTESLHSRLLEALGPELSARLTSAEDVVIGWLETRTESEIELYPGIVALARSVIGEAFSNRVVVPGVTTTDDVSWWIAERFAGLDLEIWFIPDVNLQRPGEECGEGDDFCGVSGIIKRGDVLHTDVGICYLRLCTDTQEMGYVLRFGEEDVPESLRRALVSGNRWQDALTGEFATGLAGNEVLRRARRATEEQGVPGTIYSHPLGFFGHAPGPTIGMWDNQGPTPVQGDWPLRPSTAYAIEGNVKAPVSEWDDQLVQIKLEQSAFFDGEKVLYLAGRQTAWHVVR